MLPLDVAQLLLLWGIDEGEGVIQKPKNLDFLPLAPGFLDCRCLYRLLPPERPEYIEDAGEEDVPPGCCCDSMALTWALASKWAV